MLTLESPGKSAFFHISYAETALLTNKAGHPHAVQDARLHDSTLAESHMIL